MKLINKYIRSMFKHAMSYHHGMMLGKSGLTSHATTPQSHGNGAREEGHEWCGNTTGPDSVLREGKPEQGLIRVGPLTLRIGRDGRSSFGLHGKRRLADTAVFMGLQRLTWRAPHNRSGTGCLTPLFESLDSALSSDDAEFNGPNDAASTTEDAGPTEPDTLLLRAITLHQSRTTTTANMETQDVRDPLRHAWNPDMREDLGRVRRADELCNGLDDDSTERSTRTSKVSARPVTGRTRTCA